MFLSSVKNCCVSYDHAKSHAVVVRGRGEADDKQGHSEVNKGLFINNSNGGGEKNVSSKSSSPGWPETSQFLLVQRRENAFS